MPNVEDVQRHLTDNINAITWGLEVRERLIILKLLKKRTEERKGTKAAKFSSKKRLLQNVCRSWKAGCTEK